MLHMKHRRQRLPRSILRGAGAAVHALFCITSASQPHTGRQLPLQACKAIHLRIQQTHKVCKVIMQFSQVVGSQVFVHVAYEKRGIQIALYRRSVGQMRISL